MQFPVRQHMPFLPSAKALPSYLAPFLLPVALSLVASQLVMFVPVLVCIEAIETPAPPLPAVSGML